MPEPRRRITKAKITTISLVPRGANQMPVIYKADENSVQFDTIIKDDDLAEKGELTAIVYAPEIADSQGDIASAQVVKEMAYDFAKSGLGSVDLRHDGKNLSKDQIHIAESFLVQKGDPRFAGLKNYSGSPVNIEGAWAVVIKIEDENLRQLYKDGKWNGVSMFGSAQVKAASENEADTFLHRFFKKALGIRSEAPPPNGDLDMTEAELKKMLDERDTTLVKTITASVVAAVSKSEHSEETLKKAGVKEEDSPEVVNLKVQLLKQTTEKNSTDDKTTDKDAPVFKGDASDSKAVAQFAFDVEKYKITKDMDPKDPASVIKTAEALAVLKKVQEDDEVGDNESDEMKELRIRLHKAEKSSNQPKEEVSALSGISKEDQRSLLIGKEMALRAQGDTEGLAKLKIAV